MKTVPPLQVLRALIQERAPVRIRRDLGMLPCEEGSLQSFVSLHAGQMIEVLGEGRWAWSVRFLKARTEARAAWLSRESSSLFPMALAQEGISLSSILFLERVPVEEGMDILLGVLRSGLFEVVVMDQELLPRARRDVQVRKIQLTAEDSGSLILLLSEQSTSSFGVQIRVEAGASGKTRLKKVKGGTES